MIVRHMTTTLVLDRWLLLLLNRKHLARWCQCFHSRTSHGHITLSGKTSVRFASFPLAFVDEMPESDFIKPGNLQTADAAPVFVTSFFDPSLVSC